MEVDLPAGPPLFRFSEPAECERVLLSVGFAEVKTTEVALNWPSASAEDFVRELSMTCGRLGQLLDAQSEVQGLAIKRAIVEGAAKYVSSDGVRIPSAIVLASGRKP